MLRPDATEHIGTKTAIQIRSHAQKFFTKLERGLVASPSELGKAAADIPMDLSHTQRVPAAVRCMSRMKGVHVRCNHALGLL